MDKDWMILLQNQNQLSTLAKTNEASQRFGLSLDEQDARLISRLHALLSCPPQRAMPYNAHGRVLLSGETCLRRYN